MNEININGKIYVEKDSINTIAEPTDGMRFVLVRTYSAGVHAGYLKEQSEDGKKLTLINAIRVWYWDGACSLSELAVEGSAKIGNCKYAVTVPEIMLTEAIEIIPMTEKAKNQMEEAKRWKKN